MSYLLAFFQRLHRKLFPPEGCLSGYWRLGLHISGNELYGFDVTNVGEGYEVKSKWNPDSSVDVTFFKNKVRICEVNFYRVYGGSRTGKVSIWPEFADMDEYAICKKLAWAMREAYKIRQNEKIKAAQKSEQEEYERNKVIYESNKGAISGSSFSSTLS